MPTRQPSSVKPAEFDTPKSDRFYRYSDTLFGEKIFDLDG
jgi:hypothetical protein